MARVVKKKAKQSDAEIAELVADAEGISRNRSETLRGEDGLESTVKTMGDDIVYVYDTLTGQRSMCLKYMLPQQLKKKRKDGTRVFTVFDPEIEQKSGMFKCLLHPENENREHYDELGLATCNKSNLVSEYHMNRHMQKKHKDEWNVIQAEVIKKEKEEERNFQRSLLESVKK